MNKENLLAYFPLFAADWGVLLKLLIIVLLLVMIAVAIYDRFIQRENQLLINYPLIGRMRYLFYMLRNPMRQYFGDETFYDSFEINKVARKANPYLSFSPTKSYANQKTLFKHVNFVKEVDEIQKDFSVVFGKNRKEPPINTGEGGLTSNFLATLNVEDCNCTEYLEIKKGTIFAKLVYKFLCLISNKEVAQRVNRKMVVRQKDRGSFIFDNKKLVYFRIDWTQKLEYFPKDVPSSVPDITFQMGSGLYGVRDTDGKFDEERYKKVMSFCRMTEVKLAQGAKQTGGKLLATKVSDDIAYYRGVPAHQDLISPNRFPYAQDMDTFFEFISKLQDLSNKPVGFKIVISTKEDFEFYAKALKSRIEEGKSIADFLTIDGGDGGSATAPLEMMRVR